MECENVSLLRIWLHGSVNSTLGQNLNTQHHSPISTERKPKCTGQARAVAMRGPKPQGMHCVPEQKSLDEALRD